MAEREVHLRDYLAIIRKHDFAVIASFLLVFGAALTVSLYMPREFSATATIEIQPSSKPSELSGLMQSVISSGVDQVSMETVCRWFTSRPILVETFQNLKRAIPEITKGPGPENLASRIKTDVISDTRMMEITVRMRRNEGGAERAVRVANELIAVMQAHRSAKTDAKWEKRQAFIDGKMRGVESEIGDSDQDITRFLESGGGPLVWSAQSRHLMERLSSLIELREQSQTLVAAEREKLDDLNLRLEGEPEWVENSRTFTRDPLWDKYRIDLAELRKELAAERTSSGQRNPRIESLEAQIGEIESNMKNVAQEATSPSGMTESRSSTYQALLNQKIQSELNLIAYKAQLDMVNDMLDKLSGQVELTLSDMSGKQFQLDKMNREIEYKVEIYKSLLEKKLEAEIWASENSDDIPGGIRGGIEIVDTAQPSGHPVSPRTRFIGAIAALVGLLVGLGMAFLAEYFENTYQSPDEAKEDLDIPVLGTIPSIRLRHPDEIILPALESAASAESESFRTLVTNIEFSSTGKPYESLLVTSSGAGEGKSFVAANLAVTVAQIRSDMGTASAGQVILVDCDMRKAVQHKIFGVENQAGLANLLVGNADLESVIQDTNIPNLRLITCGPAPPNPIELLRSQKADKVFSELREICGVLICDSPPVLPVADALILSTKLDGILLVADLNRTPREVIKQAREQLSRLDVPLLGLICNRMGTAKYDSYYHRRSPTSQAAT